MAYQLPPDLEQLVNEQMSLGGYKSPDDVLRDALRALADLDNPADGPPAQSRWTIDEIRKAIQPAVEQLARGEGQVADAVFDGLLRDQAPDRRA